MKKPRVTFIAFGRNDEAGEPKRMSLFIESLLNQTLQDICLWLWDASQPDRAFNIPDDDRIIVRREPVPIGALWNPTYYRNVGVLENQCEYLAHVNTDCVYGPDTAQQVMANLKKAKKLILCRRKPTNKSQFDSIDSFAKACEIAKTIKKTEGVNVCGDLQAVHRQQFLQLGGYHGLIKSGQAIVGDYVDLSKNEDTQLKKKYGTKNLVWIQNKTFVLHLWHPRRENSEHRAKLWREKRKAGKRKSTTIGNKKPRGRPHCRRRR